MAGTSLGLSDAEFMEQDPTAFLTDEVPSVEGEEVVDPAGDSPGESTGDEETPAAAAEGDSEAQEQTDAATEGEEVGDPEGDTPKTLEPSPDSEASESLDTGDGDSTDTKGDNPETPEFDYKSAFEEVSEPFKANGVEMQVKDPKDIVRLMQMGANYQKKMASMKPHLKMIKTLENNGLLDEAKLNNLIDLSKKDPKAVAKLIKESGIDPLDIDTGASTDYTPTDHSVSDKEFNLDQALDGIKDTETFNKTINVLTKEWDAGSKAIISDNPEIIGIINTHMANGVYDKVNAVVQQDKALGKLAGVSDVEAYRQVAERLAESGDLKVNSGEKPEASESTSETDAAKQAAEERDNKRRAVAPVKQATPVKPKGETEFLGLSDDEFMKKFG